MGSLNSKRAERKGLSPAGTRTGELEGLEGKEGGSDLHPSSVMLSDKQSDMAVIHFCALS